MTWAKAAPRGTILLAGGAGSVGRRAARFLRDAHPDLPLLIAGRDLNRAAQAAAILDGATPVVLDLAAEDLGIGEHRVSAVATLFTDATGAILRWAQRRGAGHISISPGIGELGPEVASFVHAPATAPMVLGTEWLVGAASVPALLLARSFAHVRNIRITAVLDEQDEFGPAANADLERQVKAAMPALIRRAGVWVWLSGNETATRIRAVDGVEMSASVFSPNDVLALANATGAADIRFDLALGMSSSRRAGRTISTEIVIDLAGEDDAGRPLRTQHAVIHPEGQMPLTGLGVALVLERLAGLVGDPPSAGLYFPSQLLDGSAYLDRLRDAGGKLVEL